MGRCQDPLRFNPIPRSNNNGSCAKPIAIGLAQDLIAMSIAQDPIHLGPRQDSK